MRVIWEYTKIVRPLKDLLVSHYTSKKNQKKNHKPTPFVWSERQQSKKDSKDQESIHSSTTPVPGY